MVEERLSPIAGLVDRVVYTEGVQGAGVAVLAGGGVTLEHYAGDARPDTPAGPETLWPVASISKLYTVAMLMRLVEQGELTLITRVRSVLPRFDGGGKEEITLRQLLTHTSGLLYEPPQMAQLLAKQTPLEAIVDEAYRLPLDYLPGTDQRYSDLGYALAGRMAAVAMQGAFSSLVRELVLEPAGLTRPTTPRGRGDRADNPASNHPGWICGEPGGASRRDAVAICHSSATITAMSQYEGRGGTWCQSSI